MLHVKILIPEAIVWEGDASAVSSKNAEGPFDILPEHANFITLVAGTPVRVFSGETLHEYTFDKAVIFAHENTVSIFANIAPTVSTRKKDAKTT